MTDGTASAELQELLDRAVALEEKAVGLLADASAAPAADDTPVSAPTVEELAARVAELQDLVFALTHDGAGDDGDDGDEGPDGQDVTPDGDGDEAAANDPDDEFRGLLEVAAAGWMAAGAAEEAARDAAEDVAEGEAPDDDEPAGMDFDEPDDPTDFEDPEDDGTGIKAAPTGDGWAPCPACGSTAVDEFADGTARCEDCGTPLHRKQPGGGIVGRGGSGGVEKLTEINTPIDQRMKADAGDLETKSADGDRVALSEIELLMARRAELDA